MNILCVAHDFALAGAQMSLLRLVRHLRSQSSVNVGILALGDGVLRSRYEEVAPVAVIDMQRDGSQKTAYQVASFIQGLDYMPDVILGNTVVAPQIYPYLSALDSPIITRVAELGHSIRQYSSPTTMRNMLRYSSHFVAVSPPVRDMLMSYGVAKERITCIPGVIEGRVQFDALARRKLFEQYRIPITASLIWGCGSISIRKGADLFYLLAKRLAETGATNFHAVWLGDTETSLKDYLVPGVSESHVTFAGPVKNPASLMAPQDIFVLSSREDPFPLVALEAGDRGLALVGFKESGGMVDVIRQCGGILSPPEDVQHMANELTNLLKSPHLSLEIGKQAKQIVRGSYTIAHVGPQWMDLFTSVSRKMVCKKAETRIFTETEQGATVFTEKSSFSISAVIRTVGERTFPLCHSLLQQSFAVEDIAVVQEKPFSKALQKSFLEGINSGSEWVLVLDADVLITADYIPDALALLNAAPPNLFVLQCLVCDKFFGVLRPAGNHIYRTSLLREALACIPEEGKSLRPESDTISAMVQKGYLFWQKPILAGLHDFEQYHSDIAKKCFLQARKHTDYLPEILKMWCSFAAEDSDFQVAIDAAKAGLRYNGTVFVDSDFLRQVTQDICTAVEKNTNIDGLLNHYSPHMIKEKVVRFTKKALRNEMQKQMFPPHRWDVEHR